MSEHIDHRPELHAVRPTGLKRAFHRSVLHMNSLPANLGVGTVVGFFGSIAGALAIEVPLDAIGHAIPGSPLMLGLWASIMAGYTVYQNMKDVDETDAEAVKQFQTEATTVVNVAVPYDLRYEIDGRDQRLKALVHCLIETEARDPAIRDLQRVTVARLTAIGRAHDKSAIALGSASREEIDRVRAEAVLIVAEQAVRDHADLIQQKRDRDARGAGGAADEMRQAISGALSLGRVDAPKAIAHHSSGTGRAHIDRLIAKAEEALAIKPDMVDAAGSRVDAAIRVHLPRLLQKHADMVRHSPVEELAGVDRMLDEGVELIRRSVEEGIADLRHEKADALRTEIGFLRMRRGPDEGDLRPIS